MKGWTLVVSALLLLGCRDGGGGGGEGGGEGDARPSQPTRVAASPAALPGADGRVPERVTFTEHVAPLVHARCATCHRPGQVAPFSLLTEGDVRDHAEQIVAVTRSRYMPPWKPVAGHGEFAGDRSLEDAQIEILARWVEAGTPTGPESARPSAPTFPEGWLGGEPDLVVELPAAYELPAEGLDVYRNFVLPAPVDRKVWVWAWELDPGNARVVHHAILSVDRQGWARAEDARSAEPGFEAMELAGAQSPGGFYLVWAPGTVPSSKASEANEASEAGDGGAWSLSPGMDLILQLHLQPTGKPEAVRPRIGLHLADGPPRRPRLTMRVGDVPLDIPAGAADYAIDDQLTLPADVDVLSVFPHAHYLGRSFEVRATLPDGGERWLLRIDDWDFSWQDQYRYAQPVTLPTGTVIDLRITYDNSADNPRNPNAPPRRVRTGPASTDEMGNVTFEIAPYDQPGLLALREAKFRRALSFDGSASTHYNLANALRDQGRTDEAIAEYEAALTADPDHRWSLHNLSMVLQRAERFTEAVAYAEREVEVTPDAPAAHNNLGNALKGAGETEAAIASFRRALALDPSFELARNNLRVLGTN